MARRAIMTVTLINGELFFPVQSEIEHLAIALVDTTEFIYTEGLTIGDLQFHYVGPHGWKLVHSKGSSEDWLTRLDAIVHQQGLIPILEYLADYARVASLKADHETSLKLRAVGEALQEAVRLMLTSNIS